MRKLLMITAALGMLTTVSVPSAFAQHVDTKGRCHDEHGRFAKMEVCKRHEAEHRYMMDKKGRCHDEHGKFAKAEMCHH